MYRAVAPIPTRVQQWAKDTKILKKIRHGRKRNIMIIYLTNLTLLQLLITVRDHRSVINHQSDIQEEIEWILISCSYSLISYYLKPM